MIMGSANFIILNGPDEITSKFVANIINKIFVVIDEVYWKNMSPKVINQVKGLVTAKKLKAEEKYEPHRWIENCLHIVTITNQEQPCPLEQTKGRRYYPLVATPSAAFDGREVTKEMLSTYCAMLIFSIKKYINEIAALLYCWPTHLIDKFACGHGVNNEHLAILEAASKRYMLKHSLAARWWFTITDRKSSLYQMLAGRDKKAVPMLPTDPHTSIPQKDGRRCLNNMDYFRKRFDGQTDEEMKALEELEALPEPWIAPDVIKILENHELGGHEVKRLSIETEIEMRERITEQLGGKEKAGDLLESLWGNAKIMKIKKIDLIQNFQDWFELDQKNVTGDGFTGAEQLTKEKKDASGSDMLFQSLQKYVDQLFNMKDDEWVRLGDIEQCISHVENLFKANQNVECSNRTWEEIFCEVFEDESVRPEDQSEIDSQFANKFGKDLTFELVNMVLDDDEEDDKGVDVWMMKFLIMIGGEHTQLLPFYWPLTDEQKVLLCKDEIIDWNPVIDNFKDAHRITDLNHPLMMAVKAINQYKYARVPDSTEEERLTSCFRSLEALRDVDKLMLVPLKSLSQCDCFLLQGMNPSAYKWIDCRLDKELKTREKHTPHLSYAIKARYIKL
jgi:hypothetical protein